MTVEDRAVGGANRDRVADPHELRYALLLHLRTGGTAALYA